MRRHILSLRILQAGMAAMPAMRGTLLSLVGLFVVCTLIISAKPDLTWAQGPESALKARIADRSLLLGGAYINGSLIVVGERGHILLSDDEGASWRQIEGVPTQATLTGVYFHDEKLGWAVGHDAVILRTTDGGEHWEKVYQDRELDKPLLDVWFADDRQGFAIGAYGFVLMTSDGGLTWQERPISLGMVDDWGEQYEQFSDWHLNHIVQKDNGRLYLAAEAGTLYQSDDDGTSWTEATSPYRGSFFFQLPVKGNAMLLLGLRGHLFRTEDGGLSWDELETGTKSSLLCGLELKDGRIVLGGLGGVVLVSQDGGIQFTVHPQADRKDISALLEVKDGSVLAIGKGGVRKINISLQSGEAFQRVVEVRREQ